MVSDLAVEEAGSSELSRSPVGMDKGSLTQFKEGFSQQVLGSTFPLQACFFQP